MLSFVVSLTYVNRLFVTMSLSVMTYFDRVFMTDHAIVHQYGYIWQVILTLSLFVITLIPLLG